MTNFEQRLIDTYYTPCLNPNCRHSANDHSSVSGKCWHSGRGSGCLCQAYVKVRTEHQDPGPYSWPESAKITTSHLSTTTVVEGEER